MSSSAKDEARNVANKRSDLVGMSTYYNESEVQSFQGCNDEELHRLLGYLEKSSTSGL